MMPMVDVYSKPMQYISAEMYYKLEKLTLRGRMLEHLQAYWFRDARRIGISRAKMFYIMENTTIVSWAMVYKCGKNTWYLDLFTKRSHRGQGYASTIAKVIRQEYPDKLLHGAVECSTIFNRFHMGDG